MDTKRLLSAVVFLVTAAMLTPHHTFAQLKVRVSVKLLYYNTHTNNSGVWTPVPPGAHLDSSGNIDTNHCGNFTNSAISCEAEIVEKFEYVNMLMDRFGRGYQFELVEIVPLTNPPAIPANQLTNVSTRVWTLLDPDGDVEEALTDEAIANPVDYDYLTDAVNFYVFDFAGGGFADNQVTSAKNDICTTSQGINGSWPRFLHEMGHYLGLFHTFGRGGGTNEVFSDSVCDTLPDALGSSQTLDGLAALNFQTNFLALDPVEQEQIFDIFYNIMSYHADNGNPYDARTFDPDSVFADGTNTVTDTVGKIRHRLTKDQLDRITNRLNYLWGIDVVSGRTVFVNPSYNPCPSVTDTNMNDCATCDQAPRDIDGNTNTPPATIETGLFLTGVDSKEDILLIRGGSYNETPTIDQPVTLRATRGDVTIGQ